MNTFARKAILLLTLLVLGSMAACGPTTRSTTTSQTAFSNIPLASGTQPEPGTDGKPRPRPDGHLESLVAANGLVYVGSDNHTLYALGARDGKARWQQQLDGPVSVYAVVNGNVYAATDNKLLAFNANNGTPLWQYLVNKTITQVQVVDGVIYVNSAAEGNSSILFALRTLDGSLAWRSTLHTTMPGLLGIIHGTIYEVQSSSYPGNSGFSQAIYALQASNAHVLWQVPVLASAGAIAGEPQAANGIVYFATTHGVVYALRAATGALLWHAAQPPLNLADEGGLGSVTMAMVNGVVYAGGVYGVSAYRASDGQRLWQYKRISPDIAPGSSLLPVVVNGIVYFYDSGFAVALRAADGARLWQRSEFSGGAFQPLTVTDDLVINAFGDVYVLRASDGTQLWQQSSNGSMEFSGAAPSAAVGEGTVFIGGDDGSVQAFQAKDGSLLWRYRIQELPEPTEIVYAAYVHFTTSTSYHQALEIVTGLGLKTSSLCGFGDWRAVETYFPTDHNLDVSAMVNSAPLWLDRLAATSGVEQVQIVGAHSCPAERTGNGPGYLSPQQAGTFVRVTFTGATTYFNVLDATGALGFRLADPCYEQARAQGSRPTWHLMSQASSFGQTHTLILATTSLNAAIWANQLRALTGATRVEAPFKMAC